MFLILIKRVALSLCTCRYYTVIFMTSDKLLVTDTGHHLSSNVDKENSGYRNEHK